MALWSWLDDLPAAPRLALLAGSAVGLGVPTLTVSSDLAAIGFVAGVAAAWGAAWWGIARPRAHARTLQDQQRETHWVEARSLLGADAVHDRHRGLDALTTRDPAFSLPVFHAIVQRMVPDSALVQIASVRVADGQTEVQTIVTGETGSRHVLLRRAEDAHSPPPEEIADGAGGWQIVSTRPGDAPPFPSTAPDPWLPASRRALLARGEAFDAEAFDAVLGEVGAALDHAASTGQVPESYLEPTGTRAVKHFIEGPGLPAGGEASTWLEVEEDGWFERIEVRQGSRILGLARRAGQPEAPWKLWRLRALTIAGAALAMVLLLALVPEVAEGRVGGGQGASRGGGGFSGGGSGGRGGGNELMIIWVLMRLVIAYPAVGIPAVIGVTALYFTHRSFLSGTKNRAVHRTHRRRAPASTLSIRQPPGLATLRERDPGLSLPVLVDTIVLVHRRSLAALCSGAWEPLAPFVDPRARERLRIAHDGITAIDDVVVGGVRILKVEQRGAHDHLTVHVQSTRTETRAGTERRVEVHEQWTFRRSRGAVSLPPGAIERLGCPSCGAAVEVTNMGACRNCDTPITAGQLQWQAVFVALASRSPAVVPDIGWTVGGEESSVNVPMAQDPNLASEMRSLHARHEDFDAELFGKRVTLVYERLQEAWSTARWERARPYVTDRMFQTLRFTLERYARQGLRNQLTDVRLLRVRMVKVDVDAWFESITVRIWGSMRDAVVDAKGNVIGGNDKVARSFSEYWTFTHSAGSPGGTHGDRDACPSCGAPLDQVNQAGICGYCDTKIVSGKFDWVLSRIDQPEAYSG